MQNGWQSTAMLRSDLGCLALINQRTTEWFGSTAWGRSQTQNNGEHFKVLGGSLSAEVLKKGSFRCFDCVGLKTHVQWKVRDNGGNVLINAWASALPHWANYQISPYLYLKQLGSRERRHTAELSELLFTLTAINLFRICVVGSVCVCVWDTITITTNYLGMLWLKE